MITVTLSRDPSTPFGTFSDFKAGMLIGYGLEPADHGNASGISAIPCGMYLCKRTLSAKYGDGIFEVTGVNGRTSILIHWGNFAADAPGKSDTEGCILIGTAIGQIAGQPAILASRDFFNRFMSEMDGVKEFNLNVSRKE